MTSFVQRLYSWFAGQRFGVSQDYWRRRYAAGGNSGAGSYGRLATFKADALNQIVAKHDVASVVELGSGDGSQLALARYPTYIGVDISQEAIDICRHRYSGDPTKTFIDLDEFRRSRPSADIALSLDVIYHLVEDEIFDAHMRDLFGAGRRLVAIYSSNSDDIFSPAPHVRHRKFTDWVARHAPDWQLEELHENPYPFAWRDRKNTSPANLFLFRKLTPSG